MKLTFKRIPIKESFINIYESSNLFLGYTETNISLTDLQAFFNNIRCVEIKQIHSNNLLLASQIKPGTSGDGILVDQSEIIGIIKTADCVPLFFWDPIHTIGGIVHVGWKGLLLGIENKLISLLKTNTRDLETFQFYLGPSIEKECYEVGNDLFTAFQSKFYREDIFFSKGNEKYLMDISKGIVLSLKKSGIPEKNICHSKICTFCENKRFPSNRRAKNTHSRIYNFLILKKNPID